MSTELDETVRALNPAPMATLTDAERIRAAARLDQIMAKAGESATSAPQPTRKYRRVRWVAVAGFAAAVAGFVAVPLASNQDSANAYASWTAAPGTLSSADRTIVDHACRNANDRIKTSKLALSERRGDWVVALYTGAEYVDSACMAELPAAATAAKNIDISSAGGQPATIAGDQFTDGNVFQFGGDGFLGIGSRPTISLTSGYVGNTVTGLDITRPGKEPVAATLKNGRYLAWWPGTAFGTETNPRPAFGFTLHTADLGNVNDAQPTSPR